MEHIGQRLNSVVWFRNKKPASMWWFELEDINVSNLGARFVNMRCETHYYVHLSLHDLFNDSQRLLYV
jgi:hypothetical protein